MNNRIILTFLILFQIILGGSFSYAQNENSKKPNIIYILADDLGIGDLTTYNENGKIQTPNLDEMAKQGLKFTDAHTSSSVCTPTRYGILTGRYNWRTPLKEFVTWGNSPMLIKKDRLTVAKLLQNNGYKTAIIGKWHLGLNWSMKNDSPDFEYFSNRKDRVNINDIDYSISLKSGALDLGFDYSLMIPASLNMPPFVYLENDKATMVPTMKSERKRTEYPFSSWIKGDIANDFEHEQVLPMFVNRTISFINEKANKENPFFIYLPLPSPHSPVLPIFPWKGKSGINSYADFVMMIDGLMGRIFKTIKDQGIEENTLVIFTSDNGCSSTANIPLLKRKGHNPSYIYSGLKGSYLEGGHRVPFLVKWPKIIEPNTISDATICTTDFMATCADIVNYNLKENEAEDSFSLIPILTKKGDYMREETIHHSKAGIFAIRKGDWKLIVSPNSGVDAAGRPKKNKKILPENILFNLKSDIKEKQNVAKLYSEKVKELKQLLIKRIKEGRSSPGNVQINDPISTPWVQASFVN